jgi:hypothetical protein
MKKPWHPTARALKQDLLIQTSQNINMTTNEFLDRVLISGFIAILVGGLLLAFGKVLFFGNF